MALPVIYAGRGIFFGFLAGEIIFIEKLRHKD